MDRFPFVVAVLGLVVGFYCMATYPERRQTREFHRVYAQTAVHCGPRVGQCAH